MPMKNPPHPGLSVRHDCLEPLGSASRKRRGNSASAESSCPTWSTVAPDSRPRWPIRLDKAFGGGAEMWCRLQAADDLAQAVKHAGRIKVARLVRAA